jgi:hypothetical protein
MAAQNLMPIDESPNDTAKFIDLNLTLQQESYAGGSIFLFVRKNLLLLR